MKALQLWGILVLFSSLLFQPVAGQELGEEIVVVVTATKVPQRIEAVSVMVEVVSEEQIRDKLEKLNIATVGDFIELVSGVNEGTWGTPGAVTGASLRGSSFAQVLVLLDGRPINSGQGSYIGGFDLSLIPVDNIERIEVVKTPASALYGADALGGAINIITKSGRGKPETRLAGGYGRFNTRTFRLTHGGERGDLNFLITTSSSSSDGFRIVNSHYRGEDYTLKLGKAINGRSHLVFSWGYHSDEKGVPGPEGVNDPDDRQTDRNHYLSLIYDASLSANSDLHIIGYANLYKLHWLAPGAFPEDYVHRNKVFGIDAQDTLRLGDRHTLSFGMDVREYKVDSPGIAGRTKDADIISFYLQDLSRIDRGLGLVNSWRIDRHSVYGTEICPRVGIMYGHTPRVTYRASVGRAFRAPTFDDLYAAGYDIPGYYKASGNPQLVPERGWAVEVGAKSEVSGGSMAELGLFQRRVKDMITWVGDYSDPNYPYGIWVPENVHTARVSGGEFKYDFGFGHGVRGFFNYTYLRARNLTVKKDLSYQPKHQLNLGLIFTGGDGWEYALEGRYVGKRFSDTGNTRWLGGHFTCRLRFSRISESGWRMSLGIDNLFNKKYYAVELYPMPPREVSVSFERIF